MNYLPITTLTTGIPIQKKQFFFQQMFV